MSSEENTKPAIPVEESTGDAALDEKLSHPVFTFDSGFEQAQTWMCAFLIVAIGLMAYSNVFRIPFHADDLRWVYNNEAAHTLTTTPQAVAKGSPSLLTLMDLALDWKLVGGEPLLYHVSSLCIHVANGVLIFLLCRFLLGASVAPVISMLAGMLFVLHPLATESVVTAVGRESLLAAFFTLAGLVLFVWSVRDGADETAESAVSYSLLAFSCVCFALGAAASTGALAFPLLVTGSSLCLYRQRTYRWHAAVLAPSWLLFAGLMAFYWASGISVFRTPDFGLANYALLKIFVPIRLSAAPHISSMITGILPLTLLCIGLVVTIFGRLNGLALLWLMASLLAAAMNVAEPSERVAYLGVAGVVLVVPWLFSKVRPAGLRAVLGIVCAVLVLAAAGGTYARNMVWQDAVVLWNDAAEKSPDSYIPARNLGMTYLAKAKFVEDENPQEATRLYGEARDALQQAIEKSPDDVDTREALGTALLKCGDSDNALEAFKAVLRADFTRRGSVLFMANLLFDRFTVKGDQDDLCRAIDYFRHAETLKPVTGSDLTRYGLALSSRGDFETAEPLLERASLGSDSEQATQPLKSARELARRVRGLLNQSGGLLAKNPRDVNAIKVRAQGLALRGQTMSAFYALDNVLHAQTPDYPSWLLMGLLRARMNNTEGFLKEWSNPPAPPKDAPSPWIELARTAAGSGLWDEARAYALSPQAATELGDKPLLTLAEIALQFRQGRRAYDYLNEATKAYPTDPTAWLRLCDIATAGRDGQSAQNFLREAESRQADPAEVDKRKKAMGGAGVQAPAPGTIVQ